MKTCIVTGASAGIGLAIAEVLAERGQAVVMLCRDAARGEAARERVLARAASGARVELVQGDLSTVASTHAAASALEQACPRIDVLIQNAGVWPTARRLTADGFEVGFAVNHVAPFVLGQRLLPRLREAGHARIVQVTAGLHPMGRVDLERTPVGDDFAVMRTYANTKLWNLLATLELARREADTDLAVLAVHPGVIRTGLAARSREARTVLARTARRARAGGRGVSPSRSERDPR